MKKFLKAAAIRAIRTFAQTTIGFIAVGAALSEVDWVRAISVGVVSMILSLLTSIATGLPEAPKD